MTYSAGLGLPLLASRAGRLSRFDRGRPEVQKDRRRREAAAAYSRWRTALRVDVSAGHSIDGGAVLGFAGQRAVPDEPCRAALGHAAEYLVDLEPEQRDEGLLAGVGQVRAPPLAAGAEQASSLSPTMVRTVMPSARSRQARARSRSAGPRPCSASRAPASGLFGG
jgi:hypothetical protein